MKLHLKAQGQGELALVFFHGWGFDYRIWEPIAQLLADSYSLFLIDLPGFGKSSLMPWSSFKEQLLSHLPNEVALIGWSMGGLMATRLALECPERISHLVNVSSSPYFIKTENWPGITQSLFNDFLSNLSINTQQTLDQFITLQLKNNSYQSADSPLNKIGLEAGLAVLSTWDLREGLFEFHKPACFMFGRLDSIVPIKTLATMQAIYPQFEYKLFSRAGHAPFLSHQTEFVVFLEQFLQ